MQKQLETSHFSSRQEKERLEGIVQQKESEQKAKLLEYDLKIQSELDARERAEREREAARGDSESEKKRLANLLKVNNITIITSNSNFTTIIKHITKLAAPLNPL